MSRCRTISWGIWDCLALGGLLLSGLLIIHPVFQGLARSYLDNPCHLAELKSLAGPEGRVGWSRVAMAGFPIGMLHSPLWYGGLARLASFGIDPELLLAVGLMFGFLAPVGVVYLIARTRGEPLPAFVLAWLYLARRPAIVGVGSILGGMWTYGIALGLFLLLLERVSRGVRDNRDVLAVTGMLGLLIFTHVYSVVPIAFLILTSLLCEPEAACKRRLLIGAGAGAVVSTPIWVPQALSGSSLVVTTQNFDPGRLFQLLFLPVDALEILKGDVRWPAGLLSPETIGFVIILGLSCAVARWGANDPACSDEDRLGQFGVAFALLLLLALGGPVWYLNLPWFGPNSWRILEFIRIALFGVASVGIARLLRSHWWSALPGRGLRDKAGPWVKALALTALVGAAYPVGGELRGQLLQEGDAGRSAIERVWEWLRNHRNEVTGRVYVQDSFGIPTMGKQLEQSHLMALTGLETGLTSLGAYYGIVPFAAGLRTMSEFGRPFRQRFTRVEEMPTLHALLNRFGCSHIVTVDPELASVLAASPFFTSCFGEGRCKVWSVRGTSHALVQPLVGTFSARIVESPPGSLLIEVGGAATGDSLLVKESFHPFWTIVSGLGEQSDEGQILQTSDGLMAITGLASGSSRIALRFVPPDWPWIVMLAAGVLWIGGIIALHRRGI